MIGGGASQLFQQPQAFTIGPMQIFEDDHKRRVLASEQGINRRKQGHTPGLALWLLGLTAYQQRIDVSGTALKDRDLIVRRIAEKRHPAHDILPDMVRASAFTDGLPIDDGN